MCKKLPSDAADFVMEAVPLLTNLLHYHDSKVRGQHNNNHFRERELPGFMDSTKNIVANNLGLLWHLPLCSLQKNECTWPVVVIRLFI